MEKASRTRQVRAGKTNASEPLTTCRKVPDAIETRLAKLAWDELGGSLLTVRVVAGIQTA